MNDQTAPSASLATSARLATAEFFDRARARLNLDVPAALTDPAAQGVRRGDLDLDPVLWERAGVSATKPAAVLIPIIDRSEPTVLLTLRTAELASHAGQVAFPGGKTDPADQSPRDTALREAEEELGITRASADVLGVLDDYLTITGFVVTPWVAWLPADLAVRPNPAEVARAFSPALRAFLAPPEGVLPWRGWTVDGELVWGATAAILRGFVAVVREL